MPGAQFDVGGTTMPEPPVPVGLAPPVLPPDPAGLTLPPVPEPVDPAPPELVSPTLPLQAATAVTSPIKRPLRMAWIICMAVLSFCWRQSDSHGLGSRRARRLETRLTSRRGVSRV